VRNSNAPTTLHDATLPFDVLYDFGRVGGCLFEVATPATLKNGLTEPSAGSIIGGGGGSSSPSDPEARVDVRFIGGGGGGSFLNVPTAGTVDDGSTEPADGVLNGGAGGNTGSSSTSESDA